MMWKEAALS